MRRFLENKIALIAILLAFALALASNLVCGAGAPAPHHTLLRQDLVSVLHGLPIPPEPSAGNLALAHGPTIPPDPWASLA